MMAMRPRWRDLPVRRAFGGRARIQLWLLGLLFCVGCASYSDKVRDARAALDAGRPREAIASFNKRLGVDTEKQLPDEIQGENVLYLLERSVALQSVGEYALSSRDLEV